MRLRRLLAVGLLVGSLSACTKAEVNAVVRRLHCTDSQLWNGKDRRCESPNLFCKRTFGPKAYAQEDKSGDIGCYKVK